MKSASHRFRVPNTDTTQIKPRLREYLEAKGIEYNPKKKTWRCPNPGHADNDPSCTLYDNERLNCNVCPDKAWDIFEVAGLIEGLDKFPDKLNAVKSTLGIIDPKPKQKPTPKPVALEPDKARAIFTEEKCLEIAKKAKWVGDAPIFMKAWPYYNKDTRIEIVDIRFENEAGKKAVITFYYDGKTVRCKNAPNLMYNRHLLAADTEMPVLIVEGCKAATAALGDESKGIPAIPGFIPITWNGGGKKVSKIDWTILKGRTVYIYPDDDHKRYPDDHNIFPGEIIPWHEQPGMYTAFSIKKHVPQAKIIQPLEAARKIKPDGADIVEALEVMSAPELAEYILSAPELEPPSKSPLDAAKIDTEDDFLPFTVLGVADDGKAYFLGRHERMTAMSLASVTQGKLMTLAPLTFWHTEYATGKGGTMGRDDWTAATDSIIEVSGRLDFDPERVRGRGAWCERDGRICYHDGLETIGDAAPERLYLRMTRKDIGLGTSPPDLKALTSILDVVRQLSFETHADMIRCIAWSTLAPFAGALPWRPAGLLTGESGTGKSEIVSLIITPLAVPFLFSGGFSTEAGIRQDVGIDAVAIVVDESDGDTPKKQQNINGVFSLMRQSTSDDAPKVAKGTIDGKGLSFTMRSMFIFAAIDPVVKSIADDNRIFAINLKSKDHTPVKWLELKRKTQDALTPEICAAIRALTWTRLDDIFALADRMSPVIQLVTGKSSRFSKAESLLFAAFHVVWKQADLTDDNLTDFFEQIYEWTPPEDTRDETDELLNRLLDETIIEGRDRISLRRVLQRADKFDDNNHWKNVAGRYGLGLTADGELAMAKGHHEIMKIIDKGNGYQRIFKRHPMCDEDGRTVKIDGKNRNCLIFNKDILSDTGEAF